MIQIVEEISILSAALPELFLGWIPASAGTTHHGELEMTLHSKLEMTLHSKLEMAHATIPISMPYHSQ